MKTGGGRSLENVSLGAGKGRQWDCWLSMKRKVWEKSRKAVFTEILSLGPGVNKKDIGMVIKCPGEK